MEGYALIDQPRSGAENMAIDQRMLEASAARGCLLLRVYRWAEPTLSLGYFQKLSDRQRHAPSLSAAVVRRATGGGAILHHHDWTYSISVPAAESGGGTIGAAVPLYDRVHDAVVVWLKNLGFAARKWNRDCSAGPGTAAERAQKFLCFERRACGDVVVDQHKVMGSAQRRHAGAVLQHGSLLLARSPFAPSLDGLLELNPIPPSGVGGAPEILTLHEAESLSEFYETLLRALESESNFQIRRLANLDSMPISVTTAYSSRYYDGAWTARI